MEMMDQLANPSVQSTQKKRSKSTAKNQGRASGGGFYKPDTSAYKKGVDYASSAHRSIQPYIPHRHESYGPDSEDRLRMTSQSQTPATTQYRTFGANDVDYRLEEPRTTVQAEPSSMDRTTLVKKVLEARHHPDIQASEVFQGDPDEMG